MAKKQNTTGVGIRSKRLALLLLPSLYIQVKDLAKGKGYSVNDMIHKLLEQAVNETKGARAMDGGDLPFTILNGRPGYINFMDALNS